MGGKDGREGGKGGWGPVPTKATLDADLDTYFGRDKTASLDSDLDAYFGRKSQTPVANGNGKETPAAAKPAEGSKEHLDAQLDGYFGNSREEPAANATAPVKAAEPPVSKEAAHEATTTSQPAEGTDEKVATEASKTTASAA